MHDRLDAETQEAERLVTSVVGAGLFSEPDDAEELIEGIAAANLEIDQFPWATDVLIHTHRKALAEGGFDWVIGDAQPALERIGVVVETAESYEDEVHTITVDGRTAVIYDRGEPGAESPRWTRATRLADGARTDIPVETACMAALLDAACAGARPTRWHVANNGGEGWAFLLLDPDQVRVVQDHRPGHLDLYDPESVLEAAVPFITR